MIDIFCFISSIVFSVAISNKSKCTKSDKNSSTISIVEKSNFLTEDLARNIRNRYSTPVYVYDEKTLIKQATNALNFPNHYGLTVRFAMKSCPNAAILNVIYLI